MERHEWPVSHEVGVEQYKSAELDFDSRIVQSRRRTFIGSLLIPPAVLATVVVNENKQFVGAFVGYALHEEPREGDIVLNFNDCAIDPSGSTIGIKSESGAGQSAPGYNELADPILQAVSANQSASSNLPIFDDGGFSREQRMFAPFGFGYFDRQITSFTASFGAPFEIRGNTDDRAFEFDQVAFEQLVSVVFNPEVYDNPYITEFIACRHQAVILDREYEGVQTGVFVIPEPNKGLNLNKVVTFSEERTRGHSFGLGIANFEVTLFGQEILPEGVIIVPGSSRKGTTDLTQQLNIRFTEEIIQYLLSGTNLHDIARERDKLERITDYAWESVIKYFEERGGLPRVIIPSE